MDRTLCWIQRGLTALGLVCLVWAGAVSMHAVIDQGRAQARLDRLERAGSGLAVDRGIEDTAFPPDDAAAPLGRLEIPRIGLSAVVKSGDDEKTLRVAVGHLPDTPLPWQAGNAALAGHRDTFFRPLRHLRIGDEIRFVTPRGTYRYRATRHLVVEPDEVWVLEPPTAALTLITCYPFDFVGPAPRRFVVHAERVIDAPQAD